MEKYKYSIKKILFSEIKERESLINEIIENVHCSRSTFYRWWNIGINSTESIPSDALRKIALILGMQMDDLFTEKNVELCQTKN